MNSTEELSVYRDATQTKKTAYFEYDFTDDKPAKKDKKWSFGNLFRRKKKTNDSSSDDDLKKNSADKKKRKPEKRKKPVTFDHVVITQHQVRTPVINSNYQIRNAENVLSDTSETNFRNANRMPLDAADKMQPCIQYEDARKQPHQLSLDSINRKSRRELAKVRAEARRTSFNHKTSSDEDSQRSTSSQKFKSDESLAKLRDSSSGRKSRAARTERYLKRHSRDGENPNSYLRISKSDAESSFLKLSDDSTRSPSASPSQFKVSYSSISSQSPSVMGLSTIPPSHVNHSRFRVSNSTSNPSYKPPLSMNEYNNTAKTSVSQISDNSFNNQRSISFDADIHRPQEYSQVIHAKLQLGKPRSRNFTLVDGAQLGQYYNNQQPPLPPPRDPRRLHSAQYLDTINQNNSSFDSSPVQLRHSYSKENPVLQLRKVNSPNLHSTFKSSSEDHIPRDSQIHMVQRPSSTTPESNNRWNFTRPEMRSRSDNYQYLTEKQPRSRKPICIQNGINKSTSQKGVTDENNLISDNKTSAFLDQLKSKKSNRNSRGSPQIFTCETNVQTQIFLPSVLSNNNTENFVSGTTESIVKDSQLENNLDIANQNTENRGTNDIIQRKSTNLEEALNELEAIYNSLKLGDEDLLEMAEKRENEATQKLMETRGQYPIRYSTRGALSDSGFNYEPFDSVDASRRKSYSRKSLKSDDMAFRKINRENRAATINDPQNVASKICYLLASPIYANESPIMDVKTNPNEPDITLDDVVYRNIRHSKKLKVPEHPPPFGIPLGPITLAANSDYLHAVPDSETIKPSRIPDLVKDDLAYRNLRKDNTKEPALPHVSAEDLKNNNSDKRPLNSFDTSGMDSSEPKMKKAVRSKSANIGSLISQEVIERASRRNARDKNLENENRTLTDIADAMQIARQVLKDKELKINENRLASMSDTDATNLKYARYPAMSRKVSEKRENYLNYPSGSILKNSNNEVVNIDLNETSQIQRTQNEEKLPTVRSLVKEVTPVPVSSFEDSRLRPLFRTNSFEDALTALAIEAKEASDKFTQDLKALDGGQTTDRKLKTSSSENIRDDTEVHNLVYSEPIHLCEELLKAVEDTNQQIGSINDAKKSEVCKPEVMESRASIILSTNLKRHDAVESDHDYENIALDLELETESERLKSGKKSPFEEYKNQLLITFRELNLEDPTKDENIQPVDEEPDYCNLNTEGEGKENLSKSPGETCFDVVESVAFNPITECAYIETRAANECFSGEISTIERCDSDDESSGFHSQTSNVENTIASSNDYLFKRFEASRLALSDTLKSPKLVLETSKLNGCSRENSDDFKERSGASSNVRGDQNCFQMRHIPDNFKSSGAWHNNPATLAIACSYGIACFHQLASLDLFAVMGIIFAVLTFIAALFI